MNPHALLKDEKQIQAVESIRRVDKDGHLYYMDINFDYYGLADTLSKMLFGAGCSTFVAKNMENEYLMYRNYDYRHKFHNDKNNPYTGINVICNISNPKAKYKSIGVADAFWLDSKNGNLQMGSCDDGVTDLSSFIMLPYITCDGVNEAGLTVSVMALAVKADWKEIDYETYQEKLNPEKENYELTNANEQPDIWAKKCDIGSIAYNIVDHKAWICEKEAVRTTMPNKKPIMHTALMRLMLDNCANVNEAVALADNYNITVPMPGSDMHIMVADASGDCKVLEWVDNKMNIVDTYHCTNFHFSADDLFHGQCPRDNVLKAGLARGEECGLRQDYGEYTMALASQDTEFAHGSKTQYSCVYNMHNKTLKIFSYGDYTTSWNFSL